MGVCVNCVAVIMLLSGLLQLMKEMYGEGTPCSLLSSLCHPLWHEALASHDQSPALIFLSNAQKFQGEQMLCVYPGFPPPLPCPRQPWVGFGDVLVAPPVQSWGRCRLRAAVPRFCRGCFHAGKQAMEL